MKPTAHVTIVVDDDVCLRILSGVAQGCGGTIRVDRASRLELTLPNNPSGGTSRPRREEAPATILEGVDAFRIRI